MIPPRNEISSPLSPPLKNEEQGSWEDQLLGHVDIEAEGYTVVRFTAKDDASSAEGFQKTLEAVHDGNVLLLISMQLDGQLACSCLKTAEREGLLCKLWSQV